MSSFWLRTPDRRPSTLSMTTTTITNTPIPTTPLSSSADDYSKLQRLRHHNAILESEREYYKALYEKSVEQKEAVRKKAKDAVRLMRVIYKDFENLQNVVKHKESQIMELSTELKKLESRHSAVKIMRNSGQEEIVLGGRGQKGEDVVISESSAPISISKFDPNTSAVADNNGYFQSEGYMESVETLSFDPRPSQVFIHPYDPVTPISKPDNRDNGQSFVKRVSLEEDSLSQENARLRARVTELEGLLVGTLYHSATKATPLKITEKDLVPFTPNGSRTLDAADAVNRMISALQLAAQGEEFGGSTPGAADGHSEADDTQICTSSRMNEFFESFDKALNTSVEN
eukprot:gene9930-10980_t